MPRKPIETGNKCCAVCGISFYRKHYDSGKWEDRDRFDDREVCDDPECKSEYRSRVVSRKAWDKRRGPRVLSPEEVWLSKHHSTLNSVRYRK